MSDELPKRTEAISRAKPKAARPAQALAPTFEQLEVDVSGDAFILRHKSDEGIVPGIVLAATTGAFVLFIIVVLPWLRVTGPASLMWLIIGFGVLALVGLAMQLRLRTTEVLLDAVGVTIDQGTPIDREHASIVWEEMAGVALEPVDAKDEHAGMQLRIVARAGEAIDTLAGVAVGDLSEVRRIMLARLEARRAVTKPKLG